MKRWKTWKAWALWQWHTVRTNWYGQMERDALPLQLKHDYENKAQAAYLEALTWERAYHILRK